MEPKYLSYLLPFVCAIHSILFAALSYLAFSDSVYSLGLVFAYSAVTFGLVSAVSFDIRKRMRDHLKRKVDDQ